MTVLKIYIIVIIIVNKNVFVSFHLSRKDNMDVEIAASGFTKDLEQTFDKVRMTDL